ncbi:MAG: hypothetical protein GY719_03510 [bacterium]|nr:hypothetical protein [bacterium]
MRFRIPVAASTLHRRKVHLRDAQLGAASLFPFFDAGGNVDRLMLVWPPSRTIAALEPRPGLVEVTMWDAIEIDADLAALRDLDAQTAAELAAGRWHYDPWWVLRHPRYGGHPAVPALKATNCAERFRLPFRQLFFEHDLSRVARLTTDKMSIARLWRDEQFQAFTPDLLPPRQDPRPEPARAPSTWRLAPIWRRPDWLSRLNV